MPYIGEADISYFVEEDSEGSFSQSTNTGLLWLSVDTPISSSSVSGVRFSRGPGQAIYDNVTSPPTTLISGTSVKVSINYDYEDQLLFWTETTTRSVYRTELQSGNYVSTPIYSGTSSQAEGLAVDWVSKNVYWTDAAYNWIMVSEYSGAYAHQLVLTDIDRPRGIAVHPSRGLLFWSDVGTSPRIEMANLDGTGRQILVSKERNGVQSIKSPNGITIDYNSNRLYWVDQGLKSIKSISWNGVNYIISMILTEINFVFPFDITLDENYFFVSDHLSGVVWIISRSNTSNRRAISAGSNTGTLGITYYSPLRQAHMTSTCSDNNGLCDQMCVGVASGRTCLCAKDHVLNADGRTCDRNTHMITGHQLLFAIANGVYKLPVNFGHSQQSQNITQIIYNMNVFTMDYVYEYDMLYAYDDNSKSIVRTDLREGTTRTAIITGVNNIQGITIDWLANNIYYSDSENIAIYVCTTDGRFCSPIISDNIQQPRGIAVHPEKKYLFWADSGSVPRIERSGLSGRQRKNLASAGLVRPTSVTIDFSKQRVYWVDSGQFVVFSSDYDGNGKQSVYGANSDVAGIAIFQDHLYWTQPRHNAIGQKDLVNNNYVNAVFAWASPTTIIAYDATKQKQSPGPCDMDNGGCAEICIPSTGGAECLCGQKANTTCTQVLRCPVYLRHGSISEACDNTQGNNCPFQCDNEFSATLQRDLRCLDTGEWDADMNTLCRLDIDMEHFMLVADSLLATIFHLSLSSTHYEYAVLPITGMSNPVAVDYDPLDEKVYWTDVNLHTINRAAVDGSDKEVIAEGVQEYERFDYDNACRSHDALVYDTPHIYWSDWGTLPKIEQSDLDGGDRMILVSDGLGWPNSLALDVTDDRLYWCDALVDKIEYYNFKTGSRHLLLQLSGTPHPFGIAVVDRNIYWTDWTKRQLQRADKHTGLNIGGVGYAIFEKPMGVHTFKKQISSTLPATTARTTTATRTTTITSTTQTSSPTPEASLGLKTDALIPSKPISNAPPTYIIRTALAKQTTLTWNQSMPTSASNFTSGIVTDYNQWNLSTISGIVTGVVIFIVLIVVLTLVLITVYRRRRIQRPNIINTGFFQEREHFMKYSTDLDGVEVVPSAPPAPPIAVTRDSALDSLEHIYLTPQNAPERQISDSSIYNTIPDY
uniref:Low-density lipoprotein receptor-related protein 4-like n=1 Tax=Saccoglossus kowalevskii TaxID=10224 RepID=A0ABM0GU03_SACKO|nr:PREDICTED: low-density lipoprotein receptor-related protein 4-like [Saccoglossus kowalevskii]